MWANLSIYISSCHLHQNCVYVCVCVWVGGWWDLASSKPNRPTLSISVQSMSHYLHHTSERLSASETAIFKHALQPPGHLGTKNPYGWTEPARANWTAPFPKLPNKCWKCPKQVSQGNFYSRVELGPRWWVCPPSPKKRMTFHLHKHRDPNYALAVAAEFLHCAPTHSRSAQTGCCCCSTW